MVVIEHSCEDLLSSVPREQAAWNRDSGRFFFFFLSKAACLAGAPQTTSRQLSLQGAVYKVSHGRQRNCLNLTSNLDVGYRLQYFL
ncbi:hypothetical protein CEXT_735971 [Caerostris extrusa]|uniref:Uncharacterized protein n=1 Tax=Caerostris extrusa TaxID=172846 RepID=A0AAV4YAR7_CAEEX|nr:hypothetical protein CEXT_735971 [Caerostris extrusa]